MIRLASVWVRSCASAIVLAKVDTVTLSVVDRDLNPVVLRAKDFAVALRDKQRKGLESNMLLQIL